MIVFMIFHPSMIVLSMIDYLKHTCRLMQLGLIGSDVHSATCSIGDLVQQQWNHFLGY